VARIGHFQSVAQAKIVGIRAKSQRALPLPQVSVQVVKNWREGLSDATFTPDEVKGPAGGSAGPSVLREPSAVVSGRP
jgi:hypothetical protein